MLAYLRHQSISVAGLKQGPLRKMGQFDWFSKIGATPKAVAVLNDQPILFTILLIVLVTVILQCVLIWYIHFATRKPEQMKKKEEKPSKGGDNRTAAAGTAPPRR
ncbi:hypothetical protein B0H66DRAFT_605936 [Apodospora peruviana]|uniref:Uncharacterized protein n=1 Tax=Apodospora peruviana TaxID=516989 RepID=A0AAE0M1W5_9PEZI|nr:hypothetical protein B0H66DRAFT_605936 [Apodospora peruviana]